MKKIIVGYHGFCMDGIGSLAVMIHKWGKENVIPVPLDHAKKEDSFQRLMTTIEQNVGQISIVAILDFSFDFKLMSDIEDICEEHRLGFLLIDHHEGCRGDINQLEVYADRSGCSITFDPSRSGAYLTWEHYFPSIPVPPVLQYIDDGDRYQFQLPRSREVCGVLVFLTGKKDYDTLVEFLSLPMDSLLSFVDDDMKYVGEYMDKTVDLYTVGVKTQTLKIGEEEFSIILKPCDLAFASMVGEAYYNIRTDVHAVVMYTGLGQEVNVSVRSNGEFHCGAAVKIAQHFGGNGHPNAAGFRIHRKEFVELFLK